MGPNDFVAELRQLGYEPTDLGDTRVSFRYAIPTGARTGQSITMGFTVPGDYPLSCPGGPVLNPRILQINPDASAGHPLGAVHQAPEFGDEWESLSRPYHGWLQSQRTAAAYLAHVAHLFEAIP